MQPGRTMQRRVPKHFQPALRPHNSGASATKQRGAAARADSVMIVNTSSGGHAFIGLYLAQQLAKKGHRVTIFNDGDEVRVCAASFAQAQRRCFQHHGSPIMHVWCMHAVVVWLHALLARK